jgi:hypothetical protein
MLMRVFCLNKNAPNSNELLVNMTQTCDFFTFLDSKIVSGNDKEYAIRGIVSTLLL